MSIPQIRHNRHKFCITRADQLIDRQCIQCITAAVTDFYQFTRDSFSLEGYDPQPFDDKIPVAI